MPIYDDRKDLAFWDLPKPKKNSKEWHTIVRASKQVPFGYKVNENNERLLEPIPHELDALEIAKRHLKQYPVREVAVWLEKQTGRYISHTGLAKRIAVEKRRKKALTIKRKLAQRLEATLKEIQNLEEQNIGAYSES